MYLHGCMLTQKLFYDDTISSLPDHLLAASYVLMTTHPRRELTDDTQTLKLADANLLNECSYSSEKDLNVV